MGFTIIYLRLTHRKAFELFPVKLVSSTPVLEAASISCPPLFELFARIRAMDVFPVLVDLKRYACIATLFTDDNSA